MRIITCNVNGLRAAAGKGFLEWMRRQKPDVVCLQEIKAREADLPRHVLAPKGFHAFFPPRSAATAVSRSTRGRSRAT